MLWNPSRSLFQECNQLRLHESQLIWRCAISAERRTREQQISDAKQAIYCETKQTPFSPSFNSQRSRNSSEPNNGKCISFYKKLSLSIILQMDTGFSQKYRTYSKNTFTIKVMKYLWNINWTIGPFFRCFKFDVYSEVSVTGKTWSLLNYFRLPFSSKFALLNYSAYRCAHYIDYSLSIIKQICCLLQQDAPHAKAASGGGGRRASVHVKAKCALRVFALSKRPCVCASFWLHKHTLSQSQLKQTRILSIAFGWNAVFQAREHRHN